MTDNPNAAMNIQELISPATLRQCLDIQNIFGFDLDKGVQHYFGVTLYRLKEDIALNLLDDLNALWVLGFNQTMTSVEILWQYHCGNTSDEIIAALRKIEMLKPDEEGRLVISGCALRLITLLEPSMK